jgi:putative ABC transport system substrate-binding protein
MRRRDFIKGIVSAGLTRPVLARAQQRAVVKRIAVMGSAAPDDPDVQRRMAAFRAALKTLGWAEGANIELNSRWAGGALHLREIAKELIDWHPDVVAAQSSSVVAALSAETSSIPIVFVQVGDPVGSGFITSLARPGGNLTGFTNFEASVGGKWLELLTEVSSAVKSVGIIFDPDEAPSILHRYIGSIEAAAASLGVTTVATEVRDEAEIERAIGGLGTQPNIGAVVLPFAFVAVHRERIATLMIRHRVPAISGFRYFAASGSLMSYGVESVSIWRSAATYIDRILRGAKPEDLPVQATNSFELVINLKTAKALGLTVPPSLLARADEVIE